MKTDRKGWEQGLQLSAIGTKERARIAPLKIQKRSAMESLLKSSNRSEYLQIGTRFVTDRPGLTPVSLQRHHKPHACRCRIVLLPFAK
ncbi:hypothetical protein [Allopontixanthobacter sp.]|uniref:hypothetical protein n=1 Tax=Allopontixanthobacter sp. TaxID=2906452 RepID=UPI002ABA5480|nr:hypothetical protein [Allopontixanthobacter sp.]MDZ4307173.1 hypothetical protein [Allopontixanthobacter sp.]